MIRVKNDNYPTPPALAYAGVELALSIYPRIPGDVVEFMEPGAGNNAPFCKAAKHILGDDVITRGIELRSIPQDDTSKLFIHCNRFMDGIDFLHYEREQHCSKEEPKPHLIVTNPPYSLAEEFARKSMEVIDPNGLVVMLVQYGFSGAKKRIPFWEQFPAISQHMPRPRPGFFDMENGSTDMREYIFYVWAGPRLAAFLKNIGRGWTTTGYIDSIDGPWKPRRKAQK